jgi:type VI secretion system protein
MRIYLILLFVLLSTLVGCSTPSKTPIGSIQVVAENGANQNIATALDIVFVYDITSAGLLPKTGPEWFDKKATLVNRLATGIDVVSLQVPPAMTVNVPLPKRYKDAIGVYSFSNYINAAGQPVGNLTVYETVTIRLMPDNVVYSGR